MDWFKCLYCLEPLRDAELVCSASCDHSIHEWCIETMKTMEDRTCKICKEHTIVYSIYREFDLERATQIRGVPIIVDKLTEIAELLKNRDNHSTGLQKDLEKISDKLERLSIEHRALKFEKRDSEKRLKMLERTLSEKESKAE